jgi:hypothetical protein
MFKASQEKTMSKAASKAIGILALSLCLGTAAHASSPAPRVINNSSPPATAAPEIDPASALGGLTLLLGGLAVVRGRRIKK